jgi:hypothetical protein
MLFEFEALLDSIEKEWRLTPSGVQPPERTFLPGRGEEGEG